MPDPKILNILQGLIAHILDDATITTYVGSRVYTHVPQDQREFPFLHVRIIPDDWSTKSDFGVELAFLVDVYSNYEGDKEIYEVMDVLIESIRRQPISITDAQVVCSNFETIAQFEEPDGQAHHSQIQFTLLVS